MIYNIEWDLGFYAYFNFIILVNLNLYYINSTVLLYDGVVCFVFFVIIVNKVNYSEKVNISMALCPKVTHLSQGFKYTVKQNSRYSNRGLYGPTFNPNNY